ncbi:helix-turn-helix domain-containing protein [Rossellomorea oryzaecorticis]|uniref:Helix-turn-helix domain-containing protein n=1 Tax=Rossellomorea oryzaecorticis TaxID=1396505 RepID=A0ABW8VUB7_9BACI
MMKLELHKELRRYREEVLGLQQTEAAERLNISPGGLSNYESGKREISLDTLLKFKEVYKIPTEEMNRILYGEEREGYSTDPMILRESFEDEETAAILKMLDEHPKLKRTLASITYQTEKRQEKFINISASLYTFAKDW